MRTVRTLHLSLSLAAILLAARPFLAQPAGLQFDGSNDVVVANGSALNAIGDGDFTLEAWVKGNESDMPSHGCLFSNRGAGQGMMLFVHSYWGGSQYKILALQMANSNYMLVNNGSLGGAVLDGTCHHVAVVRLEDSLHFYVDGSRIGSRWIFTASPSVANPGTPLQFGIDPVSGNQFKGSMGHVRIWNVARTDQQIASSYQQFVPANTPGLVAYWLMNEGSGQVVNDLVGGDNGLLGGQAATQPEDPGWQPVGCAVQGVGIAEREAGPLVSLAPNPASDLLTVTWTGGDGQVHVLDAAGRLVVRSVIKGGRTSFDVRELAPGPYMVRISGAAGMSAAYVVKE